LAHISSCIALAGVNLLVEPILNPQA